MSSSTDFWYFQRILGPGPSFMCLWAVILLMAAGCALMARTASLYLLQMMGMECRMLPLLLIACWLHCKWKDTTSPSCHWSFLCTHSVHCYAIFHAIIARVRAISYSFRCFCLYELFDFKMVHQTSHYFLSGENTGYGHCHSTWIDPSGYWRLIIWHNPSDMGWKKICFSLSSR